MVLHRKNKSVRYISTERFFMVTLVSLLLGACQTQEPYKLFGNTQGTYYSITYYDKEGRDLQSDIDSMLHAFDMTASLWEEESELRKINRNETTVLSPVLADLIQKSIAINQYTHGAFDCTIGNLINAWGFGYKNDSMPDSETIETLLSCCGTEKVELISDTESSYIHITKPAELEIDLNAIAQGASVDMIGRHFESLGIHDYLIDIGGEVRARGRKPDGALWKVGIETPSKTKDDTRKIDAIIQLDNLSVVTSGNYRKYYIENGVKYSHTINPETGRPVNHTLLSVSVIDEEAWRADALATAFMVMGLDSTLSFINKTSEDEAIYFIYNEGGEYRTHVTPSFEEMIIEQ